MIYMLKETARWLASFSALFTKYYWGDPIRKNKMGEACGTRGWQVICVEGYDRETWKQEANSNRKTTLWLVLKEWQRNSTQPQNFKTCLQHYQRNICVRDVSGLKRSHWDSSSEYFYLERPKLLLLQLFMYLEVPSLLDTKTPTETALSKSSSVWTKGKEITLSF